MSRAQNRFLTLPQPPKKPFRAKESQNLPKIKSNSKFRIEGNNIYEQTQGPQKGKNDFKSKSLILIQSPK